MGSAKLDRQVTKVIRLMVCVSNPSKVLTTRGVRPLDGATRTDSRRSANTGSMFFKNKEPCCDVCVNLLDLVMSLRRLLASNVLYISVQMWRAKVVEMARKLVRNGWDILYSLDDDTLLLSVW